MYRTTQLLLLLLVANYTMAQVNDTITVKKGFGGHTFYYNGAQLKPKQLKNTLKMNDEAYNVYKTSRAATTAGTILGYTGGFMMGWSLGTAIGGGKPNWAIGGIGAGLAAVSIPFSISANKKIRKAVDTYNKTGNHSTTHTRSMKMVLRAESIGWAYHF